MSVRRLAAIGGLCLVVVVTAGQALAAPTPAPSPADSVAAAFADIPNVTVKYYDVTGVNFDVIRNSINTHRPHDTDGIAYDSISNTHMQWSWKSTTRNGVCSVTDASVDFSAQVTMPRLVKASSLSRSGMYRWNQYIAALAEHERGHVKFAFDQVAAARAAILASSCAEAGEAARGAQLAIDQYNLDYDDRTEHGVTQGAVFP